METTGFRLQRGEDEGLRLRKRKKEGQVGLKAESLCVANTTLHVTDLFLLQQKQTQNPYSLNSLD